MRSRSAFRLALAVAALAAGVLVGPLPAQAAPVNCQAPPGTSGIDQYCETVPTAGGDQGTSGGGGSGSHTGSSGTSGRGGGSVSHRTATALRNSGAGGKAILGLAAGSGQSSGSTQGSSSGAAKGQTGAAGQKHGTAQGAQGNQSKAPAARSDNPLEAIRSAVTAGTSAGPGFVWILVVLGAIMAGIGWLRYRRPPST
jgi:hypothetical protein